MIDNNVAHTLGKVNSRVWPSPMLSIVSEDIPQVVLTGDASGALMLGKQLRSNEIYIRHHLGSISSIHGSLSHHTLAVVLVSHEDSARTKSDIREIRARDSKIPIIIFDRYCASDSLARAYFEVGASDIIHSVADVPRFADYVREHNAVSLEAKGGGLGDRRVSRAIVARVRVLFAVNPRLSVFVKGRTAFIASRMQSWQSRKKIERVALSIATVSNVVFGGVMSLSQ